VINVLASDCWRGVQFTRPEKEQVVRISRLEDMRSFPEPRELSAEELKEAYALARAAFTAEDLQGFTELDQGVSMEEFLEELEKTQKEIDQRSL